MQNTDDTSKYMLKCEEWSKMSWTSKIAQTKWANKNLTSVESNWFNAWRTRYPAKIVKSV